MHQLYVTVRDTSRTISPVVALCDLLPPTVTTRDDARSVRAFATKGLDQVLPVNTRDEVGRRLRHLRFAYGYGSIGAWADFIGLGRTAWQNYEAGTRLIKVEEALKLCQTVGVTLDWIYRGEPSMLPMHVLERLRALPPRDVPAPRKK
jgi:DNA-binding XRE family transcriptional regulator